jgi:hypothetical protein
MSESTHSLLPIRLRRGSGFQSDVHHTTILLCGGSKIELNAIVAALMNFIVIMRPEDWRLISDAMSRSAAGVGALRAITKQGSSREELLELVPLCRGVEAAKY